MEVVLSKSATGLTSLELLSNRTARPPSPLLLATASPSPLPPPPSPTDLNDGQQVQSQVDGGGRVEIGDGPDVPGVVVEQDCPPTHPPPSPTDLNDGQEVQSQVDGGGLVEVGDGPDVPGVAVEQVGQQLVVVALRGGGARSRSQQGYGQQ